MSGAARLEEAYRLELRAEAGPWSLDQTGTVYSFGWEYSPGVLRLLLCRGAVAEIRSTSSDILVARIYAEPGARCWETHVEEIGWALGLREDPTGFHRMAAGDPLAGCIPATLPGWRMRSTSPWAAALIALAQQNTGFRQGWGMLYRLHLAASRRLHGPGWVFLETPMPAPSLAAAAREAGWGYRARTLEALVEAAIRLNGGDDAGLGACAEAVRVLTGVKGIGRYSSSLIRLLACRSYDSLPLDRWLARLAAEAYGVEPRRAEEVLRERFPGYAGLAALAATICCDAEPYRRALQRLREKKCTPGLREPSPTTLWRSTPPG